MGEATSYPEQLQEETGSMLGHGSHHHHPFEYVREKSVKQKSREPDSSSPGST